MNENRQYTVINTHQKFETKKEREENLSNILFEIAMVAKSFREKNSNKAKQG